MLAEFRSAAPGIIVREGLIQDFSLLGTYPKPLLGMIHKCLKSTLKPYLQFSFGILDICLSFLKCSPLKLLYIYESNNSVIIDDLYMEALSSKRYKNCLLLRIQTFKMGNET